MPAKSDLDQHRCPSIVSYASTANSVILLRNQTCFFGFSILLWARRAATLQSNV
jgi:hypothetical protein